MDARNRTVCIVEDDPIMGEALRERLELEGFGVDWLRTAGSARAAITGTRYDMLICDDRLPDGTGGELFAALNETMPALPPTVFITGFGSIGRAVALLKLGAMDYVTKPFDIEELLSKIDAHCRSGESPSGKPGRAPVLGVSSAMRRLEATLHRIAAYAPHTVITGESGAGKEVVARRLHTLAFPGEKRPFIAVNCAALSESLLESELFGHERGAFTGAVRNRRGLFEQAGAGTLFLDEIADMPLGMQVKLLRVLQDRWVVRVGGEQRRAVEFRLMCATNRDLKPLVASGAFREDLYYRISVVHIEVPPLRERHEDILWLADRFLEVHNEAHPTHSRVWGATARESLLHYPWPGNVRELKHCIERAWVMSRGPALEHDDLSSDPESAMDGKPGRDSDLRAHLRGCERAYIVEALDRNHWIIGRTADVLGISRKSLWERMRRLGIGVPP